MYEISTLVNRKMRSHCVLVTTMIFLSSPSSEQVFYYFYYSKWNKPGSETQIPYELTNKRNLRKKTDKEENRARGMGRRKRLRATNGEGEGIKGENKGK